jgi:hypothetical protein
MFHVTVLGWISCMLRYADTYQNWRIGIAIRIGYADTPIRHRYGIGEVSGK